MGGSSWSDDDYDSRASARAATGTPTFAYDHAVKSGTTTAKVHDKMNPFGVKYRESRDSAAHPNSNPIIIELDETGSMGSVIHTIQGSLKNLMGLLVRKGYIEDPQILFCAVGDATPNLRENAPLQVGQFESGLEMEDDLSRIYIEGNGGGQNMESYQNMAYFAARHTVTDAWEKRGKKGYMFIFGDEKNHPLVYREQIERLIGDKLQDDISLRDIYTELRERWNVFFVLPKGASNGGNPAIIGHWKEYLEPEHVLELDDANAAAELVATQIGMLEGTTDADGAVKDMVDLGVDRSTALVVVNSVSKAYAGGSLSKVPPGTLAPSSSGGDVKRI